MKQPIPHPSRGQRLMPSDFNSRKTFSPALRRWVAGENQDSRFASDLDTPRNHDGEVFAEGGKVASIEG